MPEEFTFIQNGHALRCEIEIDTYWRHNKATGQDYEEAFPVISAVWFKGVDISEVISEDLADAILKEYEGANND